MPSEGRLLRYATVTDKLYIVVAMLASMVSGCMTPLSTLLFARLLNAMVNYGISIFEQDPQGDLFLEEVTHFAIYNCIYGVVLIIGGYIATVLMNIAAFKQIYRIRQEYLQAALNQDFEYFDLRQTGDFASKMSDDVVKLEDGIGEKAATFVYYQSVFISSVIMALVKGWKLALLCLITFPVTLLLVGLSGLIASRLTKLETVALGRASSVAEEVLSSIRTVYAFNGQHKELERYQSHLTEATAINVKKSKQACEPSKSTCSPPPMDTRNLKEVTRALHALVTSLGLFNGMGMGFLFFCIFCSYALSFWFGVRLMLSEPQNYTAETMIAVFFGVLMGSANFGISFTLVEAFGMARGAGAHIFNLIDNVPTINPLLNRGVTPTSVEGSIEFKNVFFHYPSRPDVPVLKGINLNVQNGQTVALVGASGSGKSTIIQLISRFYDVVDGEVSLDDRDVRDLSVRWLRAQIGVVGQEPVLFNASIADNIRYGYENATQTQIEEAAKAANAHYFIKALPKGYDTLVGERGAALSGGQKQRIAIARALVRDPRILLDEATSALDTASESKVQAALDKASEGRTTIVVAHRLSTIRNADVIYVFNSGTVVESGNHETLMSKKGVYYDMVTIQDLPELEESKGNKLTREISVISDNVVEEVLPKKIEEQDEEKAPDVSFLRVLRLSKPEWKSVTAASLCSLFGGFAMPIFSVVFGDFIGTLSVTDEDYIRQQTRTYALMFVGIGMLSGLTNFVQVFFYSVSGDLLTQRLRRLMLHNLLEQELSFFDEKSNSTGALCSKLSGEAFVQGATGQRIGTVVQAMGTFSLALVLALVYEWRVGLVAMCFVPFLVVILYKQGRMVQEETFGAAKTMQNSSKGALPPPSGRLSFCGVAGPFDSQGRSRHTDLRLSVTNLCKLGNEDVIYAIQARFDAKIRTTCLKRTGQKHTNCCVIEIKSLKHRVSSSNLLQVALPVVPTRAPLINGVFVESRYSKEYEEQLRPALILAARHWRHSLRPSRGFFNFVYAAAMFYGITSTKVSHTMAAQALLMGTSSAAQAFAFAPNFQKGINAAGRIIALLNRKPNIVDPAQPAVEDFRGTGEASLQTVQFSYPTRPTVEVLKGLDLEIPKGQTVALVGSSGCGKSTVIQLLERFYDPSAGLVALNSVPLPRLRIAELRRGLGLVQQEPVLFDRTIGENIAYGDNSRTPAQDEIIEAAKQANIHNFIMSLPTGYETNIGSKGTQLSGGQKQRVAIARALIRKPQILLLDEATSALDTESEKVVQAALDVAKEGRTCVTIAHRLSTIRDADVICVIHAGRVAEKGTHQELIDRKGLYYRLYKRAQ
ncbi:Multidrug resistance protein 1 [Eumeta japonica]|uniref:ABC-type xenobiotic transporter n=1 Tax=Eumeta variegata TaxID=151549 RepID=A0A4C1X8M8_EUMVA|nr:Multidrug resistance protein 1 [Eumeta japonica]